MRVTILRGLPGAGKSTWTQSHCPGAVVISADDFFVGRDGLYRFNPGRIFAAHAACQLAAVAALMADRVRIKP